MAEPLNTITLDLPNGEKLGAPLGVWLTAVLSTLSEEQQQKVTETVTNMVSQAKSPIIKPNSTINHHVLHADPLHLGMNKNGGNNGKF